MDLFSWVPSISAVFVMGLSMWGAYRKVIKAIKEQREALEAIADVHSVIEEAYADKDLSNDDIKKIVKAVNKAKEEGADVIDAWKDVGDKVKELFEKVKKGK